MNQFLLMHKDREVALVEIMPTNGALYVSKTINPFYLPYGTKNVNNDDIHNMLTVWLDFRCSLSGRSNYCEIWNDLGISSHAEMIQFSHMCSVTDCYWFKRVDEDAKWEEVSLHKNGFSSNLNKRLFYGKYVMINNYDSPDIATDGALPKTWRREPNGKFVLLKGHDKSNIEACYEVIADAVFSELGIDHISYRLEISEGIVSSVCDSIIESDAEELVPVENLMRDYDCVGQPNFLPILRDMGFDNEINMMILGDCVIGNLDRHARNYGVIIDSETQKIKRFATLFDHGGCYLSSNHGFLVYPPTGVSFNKTIPTLSKDILRRVEDINMKRVADAIMWLPLDDGHKNDIIECLIKRIESILAFCNR